MTDRDGEMQIPTIFAARCEFCGEELDIRDESVCIGVRGWERPGREATTLQELVAPEPINRWAHLHCVERAERALRGKPKEA